MSRPENENPQDRVEETTRELRRHPPRPSDALVSRIERLAERASSKPARVARPAFRRHRLALALAAALSISVVGAIVTREFRDTSSSSKPAAAERIIRSTGTQYGLTTGSAGAGSARAQTPTPHSARTSTVTALNDWNNWVSTAGADTTYAHSKPAAAGAAGGASFDRYSIVTGSSPSVGEITSGKRLAELRAVLTLKVKNGDQLSRKTAQAMKIVRSLSGYVVRTQVDVPSRGVATAYLELKVPVKRSQEALIRISQLGKILSQQVTLEDVKATVSAQGKTIQALKREIASLEQTLSQQTLTSEARSQLQIKLARERAQLSALKSQHTKDILRGRLATITLTLTTGDLPQPIAEPSRIHKAIDRAWDGLSSEISWAATALIVASPFLVLAAIAGLLLRSRRRREERRLLEK
jgi:hypothetical protein